MNATLRKFRQDLKYLGEHNLSEKVQLWQNGIMMTVIPGKEARDMVADGRCYIINSQAIEFNAYPHIESDDTNWACDEDGEREYPMEVG